MTRIEYIESLRLLAEFFEQHPEITVMPNPYHFATIWKSDKVDPKPILAAVAKAAGYAAKIYGDEQFQIRVKIGCIELNYDAPRDLICERVKVGEKVIPARVLPATEEMHIPEKIEEIFEWKCPESLLAGAR